MQRNNYVYWKKIYPRGFPWQSYFISENIGATQRYPLIISWVKIMINLHIGILFTIVKSLKYPLEHN